MPPASDKNKSLIDVIDRLRGATVGLIGDLVADLYVSGQSDRVSREAPVLVLQYEHEWLRPGGAANVAANIAALGAKVHVVGMVGDDEPGRRLVAALRESGTGTIDCQHVFAARGRETITKTRFMAGAKLTSRQQVLRLDRQPATPPGRDLLASLGERILKFDSHVDAWIISDYGYGGTCEPLREQLREIARHKPVVADSRSDIHLFRGMTMVKPNEDEAAAAARRLNLTAADEGALAVALAERLEARAALVTLGNKGMVLGGRDIGLGRGDQVSEARSVGCSERGQTPGGDGVLHIPAVGGGEIVDLTGAGDSVAATLTAALAAGADIPSACRLANHAGAVVVMKEGAATASPDELRASVLAHE